MGLATPNQYHQADTYVGEFWVIIFENIDLQGHLRQGSTYFDADT